MEEKLYLIEYIDPKTDALVSCKISAEDKTDARDKFFKQFPQVDYLERITWVPQSK